MVFNGSPIQAIRKSTYRLNDRSWLLTVDRVLNDSNPFFRFRNSSNIKASSNGNYGITLRGFCAGQRLCPARNRRQSRGECSNFTADSWQVITARRLIANVECCTTLARQLINENMTFIYLYIHIWSFNDRKTFFEAGIYRLWAIIKHIIYMGGYTPIGYSTVCQRVIKWMYISSVFLLSNMHVYNHINFNLSFK